MVQKEKRWQTQTVTIPIGTLAGAAGTADFQLDSNYAMLKSMVVYVVQGSLTVRLSLQHGTQTVQDLTYATDYTASGNVAVSDRYKILDRPLLTTKISLGWQTTAAIGGSDLVFDVVYLLEK
jgi:hypothetical protein